jgi:hypothetical protein
MIASRPFVSSGTTAISPIIHSSTSGRGYILKRQTRSFGSSFESEGHVGTPVSSHLSSIVVVPPSLRPGIAKVKGPVIKTCVGRRTSTLSEFSSTK